MSKVPFLSRAAFSRLTTPTAKACLRMGLTPDVATILGTAGSVAGALTLFPMGKLFAEGGDALEVVKWKDLYDKIEDALDKCEDVGNVLQSIALKNA